MFRLLERAHEGDKGVFRVSIGQLIVMQLTTLVSAQRCMFSNALCALTNGICMAGHALTPNPQAVDIYITACFGTLTFAYLADSYTNFLDARAMDNATRKLKSQKPGVDLQEAFFQGQKVLAATAPWQSKLRHAQFLLIAAWVVGAVIRCLS